MTPRQKLIERVVFWTTLIVGYCFFVWVQR